MFNPSGKTIVKTLTNTGRYAIYTLSFNDDRHYDNWKKARARKGEKFIASLPDTLENRIIIK